VNTIVELTNGSKHPDSGVKATLVTLKLIMLKRDSDELDAISHLSRHSQDASHDIPNYAQDILKRFNLLQGDGSVHETVKDVVFCAVMGDYSWELKLRSPYAARHHHDHI